MVRRGSRNQRSALARLPAASLLRVQPGMIRHRSGDRQFVSQIQAGCAQECRRGVKWGGQPRRPDYRGTSARFQKCELIEPADFIFYTNPLIELDQVRAAPEQHMLAVINYFAS